jgi:hypothetical protein
MAERPTASVRVIDRLTRPMAIGDRTFPAPLLLALAVVGGSMVLIVAVNSWGLPQDEHAYWLAGQRLLDGAAIYTPTADRATPYAYWYPPVLAQVLAPLTLVLPPTAFGWAWSALLLGCLLLLGGGRPLVGLALVAFLPVAVELADRNVTLVLAVMVVFGIRRWPWMFALGAAIKLAPGLGILYLIVRRRWRDAAIAAGVGIAVAIVSVVLAPGAWLDFLDTLAARGPADVSGLIPVPYLYRAIVATGLTVVAGALSPRRGELLLVLAITLALPTLWANGLTLLVAMVPLLVVPAPRFLVGAAARQGAPS